MPVMIFVFSWTYFDHLFLEAVLRISPEVIETLYLFAHPKFSRVIQKLVFIDCCI